jgi:hypothetical protein
MENYGFTYFTLNKNKIFIKNQFIKNQFINKSIKLPISIQRGMLSMDAHSLAGQYLRHALAVVIRELKP